jgi:hypothetical protein
MSRRLPFVPAVLALALGVFSGCNQPVRQDRTAQVSSDGESAAFVDDREGVFVTEVEGGKPVKIFQPPSGSRAVSVPLWAPGDRRLVFAVARKADPDKAGGGVTATDDPDGAVHFQGDTVYTVYLRPAPQKPGDNPEPKELFTAACDHPGYVAANLAVRWRPDGRALLFVQQTGQGKHAVCEYDLKTKKTRRVFPHEVPAVVFDFSPDGRRLACVVGGGEKDVNGLWVGTAGADDWWHVGGTETNARGEFDSLLERLKAARPVWSPDGTRFLAAVSTAETPDGTGPSRHTLLLGEPDRSEATTLLTDVHPLRDLAWSPDGGRFGLVRSASDPSGVVLFGGANEPPGTLLVYRSADAAVAERIEHVRRFAGWDNSARYLAYVRAEPVSANDRWLYLLPGQERARDVLMVRAEGEAARPLLTGMEVSFPKWTPAGTKLTMWASYRFAHGSPSARLIGPDAPPGDPALVLDASAGRVEWQPVSARDKVQIGHYYLINGDAAAAWRWYEEAEKEFAADRTPPGVRDFYTGRNADLFRAVCLERLGRLDEGRARRRRFEAAFPARWAPGMSEDAKRYTADDWKHVRDLYVVEVLLSVNGADEAERYLADGLKAAASDADRLGKSLLLSQVLLLRGKNAAYADLAADTVLPLLLKALPAGKDGRYDKDDQGVAALLLFRVMLFGPGAREADPRTLAVFKVLLSAAAPPASVPSLQALLPLASPAFLATLPEEQVRRLADRVAGMRQGATDDARRLGLDFVLAAAYGRLGEQERRQEAVRRITDNPARPALLGEMKLEDLFQALGDGSR